MPPYVHATQQAGAPARQFATATSRPRWARVGVGGVLGVLAAGLAGGQGRPAFLWGAARSARERDSGPKCPRSAGLRCRWPCPVLAEFQQPGSVCVSTALGTRAAVGRDGNSMQNVPGSFSRRKGCSFPSGLRWPGNLGRNLRTRRPPVWYS